MTLLMPWPMKNIIDHIIREVPTAGIVTGDETGLVHFVLNSARTFIVIAVKQIPTIIGILIIVFTLDRIYALTFVLVIP